MTLGVIGCGNMGFAIIFGVLKKLSKVHLVIWDADSEKLKPFSGDNRIQIAQSNSDLARKSQVILLAVKPQQMQEVIKEIRPHCAHRPLLISIAAGITTRWIEKKIGPSIAVVRVMPNTPAMIGKGISAIAPGRWASGRHVKTVERILRGVGEVVRVKESLMDAVTAISGSGPAYFFYLMEQMIQESIALGLSEEISRSLVIETAQGAAQLAAESYESPEVLRVRVTSKGGTTEAAFREFEKAHLGTIIRRGIRAAAQRAKELTP